MSECSILSLGRVVNNILYSSIPFFGGPGVGVVVLHGISKVERKPKEE